jgi:hypothetical protein
MGKGNHAHSGNSVHAIHKKCKMAEHVEDDLQELKVCNGGKIQIKEKNGHLL